MSNRPEDPTSRQEFWESVHSSKAIDGVSWWQPVPQLSLDLIDASGVSRASAIIDVGAGWSSLADHLVDREFEDVTIVDVSRTALDTTVTRLGQRSAHVHPVVADVLDLHLPQRFSLWHDRAVFHFLIEESERADYRRSLRRTLEPGGSVVVATFGTGGPEACSGLPVRRYSPEGLAAEFAPDFEVVAVSGEEHTTPWGSTQEFTALLLRGRTD